MLSRVQSPADLRTLTEGELDQLAAEMRAELIGVVGRRSAHFASNLGVVELCLALHLTFDFSRATVSSGIQATRSTPKADHRSSLPGCSTRFWTKGA